VTITSRVYDPAIHHRRSIRLQGHDYAGCGVYFVTLCVADRRPIFGTVVNGRMALNDAGRAAAFCWRAIPDHFPQAALDEWVVMPDHVHGIVAMSGDGGGRRGEKSFAPAKRPHGTSRTLGSIVRGFKIGVTKSLGGDSPWQRNYYDIIVRDARALDNIRRYIRDNPAHWDMLRYGEPRFFAGNRALLELPLTAFLASRCTGEESFAPAMAGETSLTPAAWPERPTCVIGGFLSPMERTVFDTCLADGTPAVWVLAHGLPEHFSPRIQRAIAAGRLLAMTPFDTSIQGFSAARAAWCNQYALHLAVNAVIGRFVPDGMLACLLADLRRDIPIRYLEGAPLLTPSCRSTSSRAGRSASDTCSAWSAARRSARCDGMGIFPHER
jgi:REP element-mobilizing transposase RayT